jgi:hypothetical protein
VKAAAKISSRKRQWSARLAAEAAAHFAALRACVRIVRVNKDQGRRVINISGLIIAGILLSVLFFEVLAGCGEVTYFPDRTWQSNECVFIPSEISYGKW